MPQSYAGSGYVSQFGLPQEFDDQLFTNLQAGINRQRGASRQRVLDETARFPGMSGVQQQGLRDVDRGFADLSTQALSEAELAGAKEGMTDRRRGEEYAFQAGESALNRNLQKTLAEQQLAQQSYQFGAQRQDALRDQLLNLLGVGAGKLAGPTLGALGTRAQRALVPL